ncbi:hypothetical protein FOZ63_019278, partial [Perkinsus olseni]
CAICSDQHWVSSCPLKKYENGCFVCSSTEHLARECPQLPAMLKSISTPEVNLYPFGKDNGLFLFADLISGRQRLGPLRCLVDTGCCSTMVAKRVVPLNAEIRPVTGPSLMTIDRSLCTILGMVSLTVGIYDSEKAKSGMTPSKDDPRVPFNVSALVVESLAYDLILGHDFMSHFGLDIRYSDDPVKITGDRPKEEAPRTAWFSEHP